MTKKEKLIERLKFKIENDSFAYAIEEYGNELATVDEEFRQMKRNYLAAKEKIEEYLGLYE